jgi:hypothetical protein
MKNTKSSEKRSREKRNIFEPELSKIELLFKKGNLKVANKEPKSTSIKYLITKNASHCC